MFGNGAAIGTERTTIKHWLKIKFLIIPKDRMIHWIHQSQGKKRRCNAAVLFYVRTNIAPGIWWEAGAKGNIVLHPIMLVSGVLKFHHSANT
jgi:hypothetical protein